VIWTMLPTGAGCPNHRRKNNYREKKKNSCDLKPNNAAHTAKWSQEPADALRNAAAGLGCSVHRGWNCQARTSGRPRPSRLRGAGYPLAGNFSRNPDPDSHSAANGLWLHCYDANSVPLFSVCAQLPIVFFRHRK
jgi:hypothetical protein